MVKKIFSVFLCISVLISVSVSCNKATPNDVPPVVSTDVDKFTVPDNLMTIEEYHNEIGKLLSLNNFSIADTTLIDKLGDRLYESIHYNMDDIKDAEGTIYYVAKSGNDENDGKTPETAWATLDKVNSSVLKNGDAVLFNRGDGWRGYLYAKSGVSYGAYGKGPKPIISFSFDAKNYAEWVETDTPNVWKLNKQLLPTIASDVGTMLFNGAESYATLTDLSKLNTNIKFAYSGRFSKEAKKDNYIYLYCDKGNPKDVYESIEVTLAGKSVIQMENGTHDVVLNNIQFCGGADIFFATSLSNIKMSYCQAYWCGGNRSGSEGIRFGGGSGAWFGCDGIYYENCHIAQQFDSGVTPQFAQSIVDSPSIFKNFVVKDCLFEYCEYTLEYFNTQRNFDNNRYENMYFGYNFCRYGGQGFGDKPKQSRYIRSGSHENVCINSKIEYNIFDRALSYCLEVVGYGQLKIGESGGKSYLPFEQMPRFNSNIYIHGKNDKFAIINNNTYNFNETTYNELQNNGFETGAKYFYTPE